MQIDIKSECRKYTIQFRNWLESRYSDHISFFAVFEEDDVILIQIEINMKKENYQKVGMSILRYLIKTFKYPDLLKVNWRFDRYTFKISAICGDLNLSETKTES